MRAYTIVAALVAAAIIAVFYDEGPGSAPLEGYVQIIDGDTLRLGRTRVRLSGIDAPERSQYCLDEAGFSYACGREASQFLASLINGQNVRCRKEGNDRYGRTLGTCFAGDINVNKQMVLGGWAVAEYGNTYAGEELVASATGRGLWAGEFETPKNYRRRK